MKLTILKLFQTSKPCHRQGHSINTHLSTKEASRVSNNDAGIGIQRNAMPVKRETPCLLSYRNQESEARQVPASSFIKHGWIFSCKLTRPFFHRLRIAHDIMGNFHVRSSRCSGIGTPSPRLHIPDFSLRKKDQQLKKEKTENHDRRIMSDAVVIPASRKLQA